jgi:hypothetical protein
MARRGRRVRRGARARRAVATRDRDGNACTVGRRAAGIEIGLAKVHLAEAELPDLGDVVETIRARMRAGERRSMW